MYMYIGLVGQTKQLQVQRYTNNKHTLHMQVAILTLHDHSAIASTHAG
jgi:hypothetical protein